MFHKISSDQKRFFIALSLYPFSFFANTPFKKDRTEKLSQPECYFFRRRPGMPAFGIGNICCIFSCSLEIIFIISDLSD